MMLAPAAWAQDGTGRTAPLSEPPAYRIRAWTTADGLPVGHVMDVRRTRDGFVWIATGQGLVRFDGRTFRVYTQHDVPGWRDHFFMRLYEDRSGRLWIFASDGDVTVHEDGRFTVFDQRLAPDVASHLTQLQFREPAVEDRRGRLWVGTPRGALRLDAEGAPRLFREGLPAPEVWALHEDGNGVLWAATPAGLAFLDGERFVPAGPDGQRPFFGGAAFGPDGAWWILPEGLAHQQGEQTRVYGHANGMPDVFYRAVERETRIAQVQMTVDADGRAALAVGSYVMQVEDRELEAFRFEDEEGWFAKIVSRRDGGYWLVYRESSGSNRLVRFYEGRFGVVPLAEGGDFSGITTMFEDPDGHVWVGTDNGLFQVTPERLRAYTEAEGLASGFTLPILQTRDGAMWLGTHGGGLHRLHEGRVTIWTGADGLPSDYVRSLYEDEEGRVWAGFAGIPGVAEPSGSSGYAVLEDARVTAAHALEQGSEVRGFAETPDGTLWAVAEFGLYRAREARLEPFDLTTDVGKPWAIHVDRGGTLRVGGERGLFEVRGDEAVRVEALGEAFVVSIYEDDGGVLWIGTNGAGLYRLEDGRAFAYTMRHGLHSDGIWRMLEDGRGYVWLNADQGLARLPRAALDALAAGGTEPLRPLVLTEADGLPSREGNRASPAGWRATDGRLWFPTRLGAAVVDPADVRPVPPPPPVIERVEAAGEAVSSGADGALPRGADNIRFRFTAPYFEPGPPPRYRYRLDGAGGGWIEVEGSREAVFAHLSPGAYTFRLQSGDAFGRWSAREATHRFEVRAELYERPWFWLVLALLFTAAAATAVHYRGRYLRQVEMHAVRRKIAADLHDDLGSKIGSITVRLDLMSRRETLPERDRRVVREVLETTREVAVDVRDTVWSVHGGYDRMADLVERMRETARQMLPGHTYRFDGPGDCVGDVPLEMTWRRNVYLVYREALHNVVRHADAGHVDIAVRLSGDRFTLAVADDGRGFDPGCGPRGRGLGSIRERAEAVGGTLRVDAAPGQGTRVVLEARLPRGPDTG